MEMVNGYVFLDLTKSNVYAKALKVLGADKPVVIKEGVGAPYFVDSLTLDGTNVVITKGGKTITIANDNTITNVGDIQNHLWLVSIGCSDYMLTMISTKGFEYVNNDFYISGQLNENVTDEQKALIVETLLNVFKTSFDNRVIGSFSSDAKSTQYTSISGNKFSFFVEYGEVDVDVVIVDNSQLQTTITDTSMDYHIQIQKLF